MKKVVFISFVLVLTSTVFANGIDMSFGGGVSLGINNTTITNSISGESIDTTFNGLFATVVGFFDATYIEAEIGYTFFEDSSYNVKNAITTQMSRTGLNFTLHAKYPFSVREGECFFPLIGFNYFKTLSGEYKINQYTANLPDLNKHDQFRLEGGLGGDMFMGNLFLRVEMLITYAFATDFQEDIMKHSADNSSKYSNYGGVVSFKVGYKL